MDTNQYIACTYISIDRGEWVKNIYKDIGDFCLYLDDIFEKNIGNAYVYLVNFYQYECFVTDNITIVAHLADAMTSDRFDKDIGIVEYKSFEQAYQAALRMREKKSFAPVYNFELN